MFLVIILMVVLDLVILGSGPAGLTAGIYAGVYKLKFKTIGTDYGMLEKSHEFSNWPGIKVISGFELVQKIRQHAVEGFNAEILNDTVIEIKKSGKNFVLKTIDSKVLKCRALIIANGLASRHLGIGEEKFIGNGVSYCATCDARMFKNKTIGVIGGNDSAAQAALLLSEYCKKVILFYRQDKLKCQPIYSSKINECKNIEIIFNSKVVEISGEKKLEKVMMEIEGKNNAFLLDGLFPEIGAIPQTLFLKDVGVKFDNAGFIIVDEWQRTNVEGLFAAGDVTATHPHFKQAIVAAGEGAIASNAVFKFLKERQ